MPSYLEHSTSRLNEGYASALAKAAGTTPDGLGIANVISGKASEAFTPIYQHVDFLAGDVISDTQFSKSLIEVYADLKGIYTQAAYCDNFLSRMRANLDSQKSFVIQAIRRLNELGIALQYKRFEEGWNDIKVVAPQSSANNHVASNKAQVDIDAGYIGGQRISVKKYAQQRGPLKPSVSLVWRTPDVSIASPSIYAPDNGLQPGDNMWYAVASTDSGTTTTYNGITYPGVVVEYRVKFPITKRINEVRVTPSSPRPLKVLDIKYKFGDKLLSVPGFVEKTLFFETESLAFSPVETGEIRLVLLQESGRDLNLLLPATHIHTSGIVSTLNQYVENEVVGSQATKIDRLNTASQLVNQMHFDPRDLRHSTESLFLQLTKDHTVVQSASQDVEGSSVQEEELVSISKILYEFGLQYVEANYVQYAPESTYVSESFIPNGAPMEVGLSLDLDEPSVGTGTQDLIRPYNLSHRLELSDKTSIPILEEGQTSVNAELLSIDPQTLTATTQFDFDTANLVVYRDGAIVPSVYYSIPTTNQIVFSSSYTGITANAVFVVSYNLLNTFTWLDLETLDYDSINGVVEVFSGTTKEGFVELQATPYILKDIAANESWQKTDSRNALYQYLPFQGVNEYIRSNPQHDSPVIELDGRYFGQYESTLTNLVGPSEITIICDDNVPPTGLIQINAELISYTVSSGSTITTFVRGVNNTPVQAHAAGDTVVWVSNPSYEPVSVLVDGRKAKNVTDYVNGVHNAFQSGGNELEYVQINNRLYFSKPLTSTVAVTYDRWVDFLRLRSTIRCYGPLERDLSPRIKSAVIKSNSLVF